MTKRVNLVVDTANKMVSSTSGVMGFRLSFDEVGITDISDRAHMREAITKYLKARITGIEIDIKFKNK